MHVWKANKHNYSIKIRTIPRNNLLAQKHSFSELGI